MFVNFAEIAEIAFIVYNLGQAVVINNVLVDEFSFGLFISSRYDA